MERNETEKIDPDHLIEERKQENRKVLKEKLEQKLKIIRDRRISEVSNESFPEGAFERIKSNDVWGNVLGYLKDKTDVTDTYLACRTFAEILEARRILKTLPKVLNIFKRKVNSTFEEKGSTKGKICYQNWHKICLNARGVSKSWKKVVDSHSKYAKDYWFLTNKWMDRNNPRGGNLLKFKDEESVDRAFSSLIRRGLEVSPIQYLAVDVSNQISEPYYRKLMEFFKSHGSSVRFLHLVYDYSGNMASSVCERFCGDILKCMENLEGLSLEFCDDFDNDDDDEEVPELGEAFQDIHIQVPMGLNQSPPPLPALTSLKFFSCSGWAPNEALVSQILTKCVNLKNLNFLGSDLTEQETTAALMRLTLERFVGLPTILYSTQVNWPLKHLEITAGTEINMNASELFPLINRFKATLKYLYIFKLVKMDVNSSDVRLEVGNLKSILISFTRIGSMGLDDLLSLYNLQKISIESMAYEDENSKVKVKRYLDNGEMESSNVWQYFPNLKRFKVISILGPTFTYNRPTPP